MSKWSKIGLMSHQWGCHCILSSSIMSCNIQERGTSFCLVRSPYRPNNFLRDDFKRSLTETFGLFIFHRNRFNVINVFSMPFHVSQKRKTLFLLSIFDKLQCVVSMCPKAS